MMTNQESSPRAWARVAGLLYLVIVIGGAYAQLGVRDRMVIPHDPAATLRNITVHETLYRLGFTIEVFYLLCSIPLKYLLYRIFRVVNPHVAIVAILFAVLGSAVQATILLGHYAPLFIVGAGEAASSTSPDQRAMFAAFSLQAFDYGYMIALAFFGCFCVSMGYLIMRATFFPRIVGILLGVEGLAYLVNSFTHFLSPALGERVFPFLLVSGIAELTFCLVLLIRAVDGARWREQAALTTA